MRQQRTGGNVAKKVFVENENEFRSLFRKSADAQLLLDGEACIDCNDAALKMMGCTQKEELLGYHVNDHSPPTQPDGRPSLAKAKEMFANALNKESYRFEWVHRRADGTDFPADVTLTSISVDGEPLLHATVREITERNRSQRDLRESELRYGDFAELLPLTLFEMDVTGRITFVNNRGLEYFGYTREELEKGISLAQLVIPEDCPRALGNTRRVLEGEKLASTEYMAVRKDGSRFPVIVSSTAIMEEGKPYGLRGMVTDITKRKQAELRLRDSEEALNSLLNATSDIACLIDIEGGIIAANGVLAQRLDREVDNLIGRNIFDFFPKEAAQPRQLWTQKVIESGKPVRVENTSLRNGYFDACVYPVFDREGRVVRLAVYAKDITGRREAEEALRQSEEKFRLTFDQSPIGTALLAARDGHFVRTNGAFCHFTGYSDEELAQRTFADITHPDDLPISLEQTRRLLAGEIDGLRMEKRYIRKDRSIVWGDISAQAVKDGTGRVLYTLAAIQDITKRKRTEQALRESEERYRAAIEHSNDGVVITREGRHVYVNQRFLDMFGYDRPEDLLGKSIVDARHVHPEDRAWLAEMNQRRWKGELAPSRYVHRAVGKDGALLYVEASSTRIVYQGEPASLSYLRDATDRKQAEEKISASLREKEVLLKEIHHRVKNNLQIVSSLLYLQTRRTEHPGAISALRESRNRIRSMALIHEKLYQSPNLSSVDMGKYTRDLVSDLQQSHRAEDSCIRLTVNIGDIPLGISEAIPCGLIINELVSNSLKHAFPEGREGEITIQLTRGDGDSLTLLVRDNGIGIPEHVDFRNPPSLGLTLITSLVKQLDGTIQLDSRGGTTFTITFG